MYDKTQQLQLQLKALISLSSIIGAEPGFEIFTPEENLDSFELVTPHMTNNLVFGKRMERLFSQYLQQSKRYSLIAENLQLIDNKRTIGELDFLIEDRKTSEIIHLEMACKFYTYRPGLSPDNMACWIGPNNKDRLVDKLAKLKEKQFPLLNNALASKELENLGLSEKPIHQKLFIPGILFSPKGYSGNFGPINHRAVKGYWISRDEFEKTDYTNTQMAIPAKENWMIEPQHNKDWMETEAIKKIVLDKLDDSRSPMVWVKTNTGNYERFFVLWW